MFDESDNRITSEFILKLNEIIFKIIMRKWDIYFKIG